MTFDATRRAWREGVVLPWLLGGVALAASVRVTTTGELRIVPPALSALVLMLLVIGVLLRSGQLSPAALVGVHRRPLERASGAAVLITLGWASAAVIALVTPEAGLPRLAGLILITALVANTFAATAGRVAALRALFVTVLAGFVTKFIVLDALYDPTRSLAGRLLTTLLEGATLGGMAHVVWSPITGYLAFGTVLLYFLALMLLPRLAETSADADGLVVRHEIARHDPSG